MNKHLKYIRQLCIKLANLVLLSIALVQFPDDDLFWIETC
jgi:hypothetical protein